MKLSEFLLALTFVTSLPLPSAPAADGEALRGLARYLPSAGIVIGVLLYLGASGLAVLGAAPLTAAVALWLSWLIVTGGLHLDGLMDTADGIFSNRDRQRMLEIMRDSRVGNFGVMAGMAVVLLKIAGLFTVYAHQEWAVLLLVPCWTRWCQTFAIAFFPSARHDGMGKIWHDTAAFPGDVILAALPALAFTAIVAWSGGWQAVLWIISACLVTGLPAGFFVYSILKGHTGDTYGAIVEVGEAGALFFLCLLLS